MFDSPARRLCKAEPDRRCLKPVLDSHIKKPARLASIPPRTSMTARNYNLGRGPFLVSGSFRLSNRSKATCNSVLTLMMVNIIIRIKPKRLGVREDNRDAGLPPLRSVDSSPSVSRAAPSGCLPVSEFTISLWLTQTPSRHAYLAISP